MKDKRGFTLIEIIIVVMLIAVVGLLMYSFFGQGFRLYTVESESADKQMNLRQVMSDITNRARLADPAAVTYTSGVLNVGTYAYMLSNGQVKRNDTVLANDVAAFNISINTGILGITMVNTSGTSLSTSISLLE